MALTDNAWYVDFGDGATTGYYAVTVRPQFAAVAAGVLRRQFTTPAVGSERVFICVIAGTTANVTDATWVLTRGALTTDGSATWQECTGLAGINGDLTNTPNWTTVKAVGAVTLGQLIQRNNAASYQICTTAGTPGGSEPAFSDTAGVTTADGGTLIWTSCGVAGNFTGNQAPHARISNATASTWAQVGNSIFVKSSHAESSSVTITLGGVGSAASPLNIMCHNGGAYPPLSGNLTTGASVTVTGNTVSIDISNFANYNGIAFISTGLSTPFLLADFGTGQQTFTNCSFSTTNASTNSHIQIRGPARLVWDNVTVGFSAGGQFIQFGNINFLWKNTLSAITGAVVPNTLFSNISSNSGAATLSGVDLSGLGSGKSLLTSNGSNNWFSLLLRNCKLPASLQLTPVGGLLAEARVSVINCSDTSNNYIVEANDFYGEQTTETTIVRSGGATDGTTPVSWKLVTSVNSKFLNPFPAMPIAIWNDTVGSSVTATIYGIWGTGSVPNNDDIWIEAEYLGSSATPQSSFITDTKANVLATGIPLSSDSSSWGGSTTPFKMSVAFTPQMKGLIYIVVKAAKLSTTFYVDPKIVLS